MTSQITLAYTVSVAGTSYGPAQAAAELADVELYTQGGVADPVLGQLFGLTVAGDTTTNTATTATRTIVLNTDATHTPTAPPSFPGRPITAIPPGRPGPLLQAKPLPGFFLTTPGDVNALTTVSERPSLSLGNIVQFASQPGVFYTVAGVFPTFVALTTPYTGPFSADGTAAVMIPAPAVTAAIYSTSPLDTAGVPTTPAIPPGTGAQSVTIEYLDSTGAGPFTVTTSLAGKYPAPVTLAAGSVDIYDILSMSVATAGSFGNSVGQITLCELSTIPPAIPVGISQAQFQLLTDQTQLLITRPLGYMPPSFAALAQQGNSAPILPAGFTLSPGSPSVPVSADLTGTLSAGQGIQFTAQPTVDTPFGGVPQSYIIAAISPGLLTLTSPWVGLNDNSILSSAQLVAPPLGSPPNAAQLETLVGEFVNPGTAIPPPNPPLSPQTMNPAPTFLSGLFGRTLQLALAVPVVPSAIVLS
jgi:hypothetical protein